MNRYKGRASRKTIEREFPHVVEIYYMRTWDSMSTSVIGIPQIEHGGAECS
jgi:hypothetical protein